MMRKRLASLYSQRNLIIAMTRRELSDRYAGQVIGAVWSVVHPVLLVTVYVVVFGVVFGARIHLPGMPSSYTAFLMSGLFPWLAAIDAMARSSQAITANAALVKQIIFPNEVLVIRCVLAALFGQMVATIVLVLYLAAVVGTIPIALLLLPPVVVLYALFLLGLCYILATIGVFVRDIKDIVQAVGVFGMYLAPIVYVPGWLPELIEFMLMLNPFSHVVWVFQDVLFFDAIRHPESWVVFAAMAIGSFYLGSRTFKHFEHSFANVL